MWLFFKSNFFFSTRNTFLYLRYKFHLRKHPDSGARRLMLASDHSPRTTRRGVFSVYPIPLCSQTLSLIHWQRKTNPLLWSTGLPPTPDSLSGKADRVHQRMHCVIISSWPPMLAIAIPFQVLFWHVVYFAQMKQCKQKSIFDYLQTISATRLRNQLQHLLSFSVDFITTSFLCEWSHVGMTTCYCHEINRKWTLNVNGSLALSQLLFNMVVWGCRNLL